MLLVRSAAQAGMGWSLPCPVSAQFVLYCWVLYRCITWLDPQPPQLAASLTRCPGQNNLERAHRWFLGQKWRASPRPSLGSSVLKLQVPPSSQNWYCTVTRSSSCITNDCQCLKPLQKSGQFALTGCSIELWREWSLCVYWLMSLWDMESHCM